ncbi:hypothetical protein ACH5RR_018946 [Cinchona calisaya]|uniref:Uncharacterized protein n=1 Tax=Cinchona calisaya TaxID=153742 RepID=A0ABD2ZMY2_9GENT
MSTDLELRQELLEIRVPTALNVKISQSSDNIEDDDQIGMIIQSQESTNINEEEEEEGCRTPKFAENMIPKILSCPPAPKKPRRVASSSCKRKLSEFFESVVGREEVESFFLQFEVVSKSVTGGGVVKKRCLV